MRNLEPNASGSARCQPWGFWTTTAFALISVMAWMLFQYLAVVAALAWFSPGVKPTLAETQAITSHGMTIALATIVSAPAAIGVLAVAVRMARCSFYDYLALRTPSRPEIVFGIILLAILLPASDVSSYLTGRDIVPAFIIEAYRTARASGHVVVLAIALVIAAPLMEELLFRGFLFAGYSESWFRAGGAIVVTSALWAVMHVQYETFYIAQIFLLGCLLGWLRWRGNSTLLTVILHGIVNLTALIQTVVVVEFMS